MIDNHVTVNTQHTKFRSVPSKLISEENVLPLISNYFAKYNDNKAKSTYIWGGGGDRGVL